MISVQTLVHRHKYFLLPSQKVQQSATAFWRKRLKNPRPNMLGCLFGALIALLLSSLAKADEPGVVVLTDQSFSRVVIQSKTPSFVQFHAPWCHYCKMMIPVWMELAGIFHDKGAISLPFSSSWRTTTLKILFTTVLVGKIDCDSNTGIRYAKKIVQSSATFTRK